MVVFSRLIIRNFKRFSGEHIINLRGKGPVTIIAAKNGDGKTTTMDAFHISLYGKRGFQYLYPGINFDNWLKSAYSVDANGENNILLSLEIQDPILGPIKITRTYWLLDNNDSNQVEEEVSIEIRGQPLQRESWESKISLCEIWIEDYLPHAAMRRFLVDGERLSHLDPKSINDDIINGIDDIIGIGTLHKMNIRLNKAKKRSLKSLIPDNQDSIENLLQRIEINTKLLLIVNKNLLEKNKKLESDGISLASIQEQIENMTKEKGSENVKLRTVYAIKQSKLSSSRKELHQHLLETMPFIFANLPDNLENWKINKIIEEKKYHDRMDEQIDFFKEVLNESKTQPQLAEIIISKAYELSNNKKTKPIKSPLNNFNLQQLKKIIDTHKSLSLPDAKSRFSISIIEAIKRLTEYDISEKNLKDAIIGTGINEKAIELKNIATGMGSLQAEIIELKRKKNELEESSKDTMNRISQIRQVENKDSTINRRINRIEQLIELVSAYITHIRSEFAGPLETSFKEGFELLSRKSNRLNDVKIDTNNYSIFLQMNGFSGNWLDRDLSATEKQHVGLALIYALRKSSGSKWSLPLPVIIDTPTSRMDREHKAWSVTKFYPKLSNQVIVFATSDDLGDGLYQELQNTGSLGSQLLIQEISENSVEVIPLDLKNFFGGM